MKRTKLMAAIATATITLTSMAATSISASATVNDAPIYMLGDVNGDLKVDMDDSYLIKKTLSDKRLTIAINSYVQANLSSWFPNAVCANAADANQDGYISEDDAQDINQYYINVSVGHDGYKNIGKLYAYIAN